MQRVTRRLTGDTWDFWDEAFPLRPKGMHRSTYQRRAAIWAKNVEIVDSAYCLKVGRFLNAMLQMPSVVRTLQGLGTTTPE